MSGKDKRHRFTQDGLKLRIIEALKKNPDRPVPYRKLYDKCRGKVNSRGAFRQAIEELAENGEIYETDEGIGFAASADLAQAKVTRVADTFGFIEKADGTEAFVPGKYLAGAMPGDKVLARFTEDFSGRPVGTVLRVKEESGGEYSGVAIKERDGGIYVLPDCLTNIPLVISRTDVKITDGDKVAFKIIKRGKKHSDHKVWIIDVFGNSETSLGCISALARVAGIQTEFSPEVQSEAVSVSEIGIPEEEAAKRLDLREETIFTIDGADTKDIDDAISVKKTRTGYDLGVHIADVSYYVKPGSELDGEAMKRGTSVYYADTVIPMLPEELSNGICSLNPNEDRLAFSALIKLDEEGEIKGFKFSKTIIRSKLQGVYSEINELLEAEKNNASAPEELLSKYAAVRGSLTIMAELADILTARRIKRGAPQIETSESKLIMNEDGTCAEVLRRDRGRSEVFIEEFMLTANTAAAKLAKEKAIPFIYRIHEKPAAEKVDELIKKVSLLGIKVMSFRTVKPKHIADILKKTKDTPFAPAISSMALRSMAKAKYSDEPLGHFGLVLNDYAHFTSPIRRYPDLAIHRILSDLCHKKLRVETLQKRYAGFVKEASEISSSRELGAMRFERSCEDIIMAEYMHSRIGESFEGMIAAVADFGFYVELPNTIRGLVRMESLDGQYEYDGSFSLTKNGKPAYSVGDKIKVICSGVQISFGRIDFDVDGQPDNLSAKKT